jgi:Domain of unknown function (DUF4920)
MRIGSFRTLLAVSVLAVACSKAEPVKAPPPAETPVVEKAPAAADKAPAADKAAAGPQKYGKVSEGPTVTPEAILADVDGYAGKAVRVEGTVSAVCEKAGCWMQVAGATEGQGIRIKVVDGEVVFPMSAKGKKVIAEGTVVKIPADPASDNTATCGGKEDHADHAECARPAGATARIDGVGATVIDS